MRTAVPMLLLLAAAAAAAPPPDGPAPAAAPVAVAFRLASPEPVAGWERLTMAHGDIAWWVAPEVLLDGTAVAAATAMPGEGDSWLVEVLMTPQGRERLAEVTGAHEGEHLGILIDGRLLSAPLIRAPITQGRAVLTGHFDAEEARRIAAGVVAGPRD